MQKIVTDKPVLVTGVTGYIGASLVDALLKRGYKVRGTARSLEKVKKLPFADKIELFEADLLKTGSFDEAISGCVYVFHTASPTTLTITDPQKQLIDPAMNGTKNVLASCEKNKCLKRVILTSSVAAMRASPEHNSCLSEKDWNTDGSLTHNAYSYSKVLAEKYAWEFVKDKHFDLVTILPVMVIGQSVNGDPSGSTVPIQKILSGDFGVLPDIIFWLVNIKDVALAHILGMENPNAKGRYLVATESLSAKGLSDILVKNFPDCPVTTSDFTGYLGGWVVWAMSYLQDKEIKDFLQATLGVHYTYDLTRMKDLGITKPHSIVDGVIETGNELINLGKIKKNK